MKFFFFVFLVGCTTATEDVVFDADVEIPDATTAAPDVVEIPDASPPDATPLCPVATSGHFIGDSIVAGAFFYGGSQVLKDAGHTVTSQAQGGAPIASQVTAWMTSPRRGDPDLDWVWIQMSINSNALAPEVAAEQIATVVDDIHASTPNAKIYLSTLTPMKSWIDKAKPSLYEGFWLPLNASIVSMGGVNDVGAALDDGASSLRPEYDSGDNLHPNATGDVVMGEVILGWLQRDFVEPCP